MKRIGTLKSFISLDLTPIIQSVLQNQPSTLEQCVVIVRDENERMDNMCRRDARIREAYLSFVCGRKVL